jgi:hypothetical protein
MNHLRRDIQFAHLNGAAEPASRPEGHNITMTYHAIDL